MKRYLGVITDENDIDSYKETMTTYASIVNKKIDLVLISDTRLFQKFLQVNYIKYCRVIFYDYDEFVNFNQFRDIFSITQKFNLEFSIIKQDLHSDVALSLIHI